MTSFIIEALPSFGKYTIVKANINWFEAHLTVVSKKCFADKQADFNVGIALHNLFSLSWSNFEPIVWFASQFTIATHLSLDRLDCTLCNAQCNNIYIDAFHISKMCLPQKQHYCNCSISCFEINFRTPILRNWLI